MANKTAQRFPGSAFIGNAVGSSKDILTVVLDPQQLYTEAEVTELVEKLLQKEVQG